MEDKTKQVTTQDIYNALNEYASGFQEAVNALNNNYTNLKKVCNGLLKQIDDQQKQIEELNKPKK